MLIRSLFAMAILCCTPSFLWAQYSYGVDMERGSVICKPRLVGPAPGGPLLTYDAYIYDPDGNQIAYEYKWTYSYRLDGQFSAPSGMDGTYKCVAYFNADGNYLGQNTAELPMGCAHPTNFTQVAGYDYDPGVLRFTYTWDSSTGRNLDLTFCKVRERVVYSPYPFPVPPFHPNMPPNPNIEEVGAFYQAMDDFHDTARPFQFPYSAVTVNGGQKYQHNCGCNGIITVWQDLFEPFPGIDRTFWQSGGGWNFTIWKSGVSSTIGPF